MELGQQHGDSLAALFEQAGLCPWGTPTHQPCLLVQRMDLHGVWFHENDVFLVRPHDEDAECTCHKQAAMNAWHGEHKPDCRLALPNFVHKPSGLRVTWYKSPWRDCRASRDISPAEWQHIMDECQRSIGGARIRLPLRFVEHLAQCARQRNGDAFKRVRVKRGGVSRWL